MYMPSISAEPAKQRMCVQVTYGDVTEKVIAKFHYASWFGAGSGSEHASDQIPLSRGSMLK